MPKPALLIRADASLSIGTGHVMRCLALAEAAIARGITCTVLSKDMPESLRKRASAAGCDVLDLRSELYGDGDREETAASAVELSADWIIVDGYGFSSTYQKQLKGHGVHILWVDDYNHATPYSADLVLNQNCYAEDCRDWYAGAKTLLGTQYVLLRSDILKQKPRESLPEKTMKHLSRSVVAIRTMSQQSCSRDCK